MTQANEPIEPTTLDELMSKDPLELTDQDLDKIVVYHRQMRAKAMTGQKVPRAKPARSGESLLDALGLKKAPVANPEKRRF